MKTFCILSGIIVGIVFPILLLDYVVDNNFLQRFMENESLAIMGNMLAIYVGVVTAFTVILDNLQKKFNTKCLNTQKNLKKNILIMLVVYGLQIICFVATPKEYYNTLWLEYMIKGFEVLLFSLYFLMFYEIIDVFFFARGITQEQNTTQHSTTNQTHPQQNEQV